MKAEVIYLADYQHKRRAELEALYMTAIDEMTAYEFELFMAMEKRREIVLGDFFRGRSDADKLRN